MVTVRHIFYWSLDSGRQFKIKTSLMYNLTRSSKRNHNKWYNKGRNFKGRNRRYNEKENLIIYKLRTLDNMHVFKSSSEFKTLG